MYFEKGYASPLQSRYGYAAFIKWVFDLDLKDSRDIGWRILLGKLFQIFGAATEKERNPYVFRFAEGSSNKFRSEDSDRHIGLQQFTDVGWCFLVESFVSQQIQLILNSLLYWQPVQNHAQLASFM